MKKLLSILMIIVLAVSLTACSGKEEPADNKSGQTESSGISKKDNTPTPAPTAAPTAAPEPTATPEPTAEPEPTEAVPEELTIQIITNAVDNEVYANANFSVSYETLMVLNDGYDALKAYINDFNAKIEDEVLTFAEASLQDVTEYVSDGGECYIECTLFLPRVDDEVVSIGASEELYLGGAHPSHMVTAHNIDTKTGKEINLLDFYPDGKYCSEYSSLEYAILYELQNHPYAEGLFYDYRSTVSSLMYDDEDAVYLEWFYGKDKLTILFNEYQVGPYAAGIYEVEIPFVNGQIAYPERSEEELIDALAGVWNIFYSELEGWGELVGFDEYGEIMDGAPYLVFHEDGTLSYYSDNSWIFENAALTFANWTKGYGSNPNFTYFYVDAGDEVNSYYGVYDGENVYFTNEIEYDGEDYYHVANYMVYVPGAPTYHEAYVSVASEEDYSVTLSLKEVVTLVSWDSEEYLAEFGLKPEDFESDWMQYVYPDPARTIVIDRWYGPLYQIFNYETMMQESVDLDAFLANLYNKSEWNDYYGPCVVYVNGQYGPILISEEYGQ